MPEGESFAIATQQAHATGHSPKGYGTAEGRHEAKEKYTTPGDDEQKASPKSKTAGITTPFSSALVGGFFDELEKIAGLLPMPENSLSEIKTPSPKPASTNPLKKTISAYSQPKTLAPTSPSAGAQPTSGAPAVRT